MIVDIHKMFEQFRLEADYLISTDGNNWVFPWRGTNIIHQAGKRINETLCRDIKYFSKFGGTAFIADENYQNIYK